MQVLSEPYSDPPRITYNTRHVLILVNEIIYFSKIRVVTKCKCYVLQVDKVVFSYKMIICHNILC